MTPDLMLVLHLAALGLQGPIVLPPQDSYHYLTQTGQLCALQNTFADPEDFNMPFNLAGSLPDSEKLQAPADAFMSLRTSSADWRTSLGRPRTSERFKSPQQIIPKLTMQASPKSSKARVQMNKINLELIDLTEFEIQDFWQRRGNRRLVQWLETFPLSYLLISPVP